MPQRFAALVAVTVLTILCSSLPAPADTPTTNIGKKIAAFDLKSTEGKTVSLGDFKDKKAIVVVFVGIECPLNNLYLPGLAGLYKEYATQGVAFLAINANHHDALEQMTEHARKHGVPFPVLKDEDNRIADRFGARRTPEAFLLDAGGVIRYQGRIDDQFGIGYKRPKATRRDLAEAIDEMLAGKEVSKPTTPVAGCLIGRVAKPKAEGSITFSKQIAPILQRRCQDCHRPGQVGPMTLLTYEDATAWAETIREVVSDQRMPPWHADPRYGKFSNDRRLPAEERSTLLAWLDRGTPRGEDRDLPPPREFVSGWTIGKPDLILRLPKEVDVPAQMPRYGIPYKHYAVDPGFKEDHWVVGVEAKPDAADVVHHIVVFVVPPGERFVPGNPETPALGGTAPGDMPLIMPPGMAKRVPAGSKLMFQMHYTPNGKPRKDRSSIGLVFAKKPPEREVVTVPIFNLQFHIPSGADNYQVESRFTFKENGRIVSFMPHMHLRGKDFRFEAIYPDGSKETLLSVPRFDFNWQSVYRLAEPKVMPKGSQIHCIAHFDNSSKNLNNPDPTKAVVWGDQTWEEMMIGWMDYLYEHKAE